MYELRNDFFYDMLAKYSRCVIDYCLLKNELPYQEEKSHRDAVLYAMQKFSYFDDEDEPNWNYDINKAKAIKIDAKELLALPDKPWKTTFKWKDGTNVTCYDRVADGGPIPYWQAFLDPPHGSNYTNEDFIKMNKTLFPNGTEQLIVFEWSTDWSDYFDDGHEWWGASCWSIYDKMADRYIVIMASATD